MLATLSRVQMSILELTSGESSDCEPQTHGTTQATLQTEYSITFVLSKNCVLGVFLISPHKGVFYPNVAHIYKQATLPLEKCLLIVKNHLAPPPASVAHWSPPIHVFPVGLDLVSVLLVLKKQTLHSVVFYLCSQIKGSFFSLIVLRFGDRTGALSRL